MGEPNWPLLIVTMVKAKEALSEVDGGLWPYTIPKVRASEDQVSATEKRLGVRLPPSYRSFLLHANGWDAFFQGVDLLSCDGLVAGPQLEYARAFISSLDQEDWSAIGLDPDTLLIIAVTLQDRDLFALDLSRSADEENYVVWLAGEKVDEWPSFAECFKSMIAYTLQSVEEFASGAN